MSCSLLGLDDEQETQTKETKETKETDDIIRKCNYIPLAEETVLLASGVYKHTFNDTSNNLLYSDSISRLYLIKNNQSTPVKLIDGVNDFYFLQRGDRFLYNRNSNTFIFNIENMTSVKFVDKIDRLESIKEIENIHNYFYLSNYKLRYDVLTGNKTDISGGSFRGLSNDNQYAFFAENNGIYRYDIHKENLKKTKITGKKPSYIHLSKNNTKIIFSYNEDLYSVNFDGTGELLLREDVNYCLLTPDGSRVIFTSRLQATDWYSISTSKDEPRLFISGLKCDLSEARINRNSDTLILNNNYTSSTISVYSGSYQKEYLPLDYPDYIYDGDRYIKNEDTQYHIRFVVFSPNKEKAVFTSRNPYHHFVIDFDSKKNLKQIGHICTKNNLLYGIRLYDSFSSEVRFDSHSPRKAFFSKDSTKIYFHTSLGYYQQSANGGVPARLILSTEDKRLGQLYFTSDNKYIIYSIERSPVPDDLYRLKVPDLN